MSQALCGTENGGKVEYASVRCRGLRAISRQIQMRQERSGGNENFQSADT